MSEIYFQNKVWIGSGWAGALFIFLGVFELFNFAKFAEFVKQVVCRIWISEVKTNVSALM